MRVIITGATGFIGRALARRLSGRYEVVALSRNAKKAAELLGDSAGAVAWDGRGEGEWVREIEGAAAVVNLAGQNVGAGRWSKSGKARILNSRVDCTAALVEAIRRAQNKPAAMIQASAIGYYGPRGDEPLDESSSVGTGFLADVCRKTENIGREVEDMQVRYVVVRTGIVLGADGGALSKMIRPYRFYLGGHLGGGSQWLSWISLADEVAAIEFLLKHDDLSGAFNLTAPKPVTARQFARTLGRALKRPAWLPVPAFALKLLLGQMADELLLTGQKVLPNRLTEAGFEFRCEDLEGALGALVSTTVDESVKLSI